jgi:hypothetical protein
MTRRESLAEAFFSLDHHGHPELALQRRSHFRATFPCSPKGVPWQARLSFYPGKISAGN